MFLEISIHTPTKGATSQNIVPRHLFSFQSTLPRRERLIIIPFSLIIQEFQSTLPRRERHNSFIVRCCICKFQSTLPRRERLKLPIQFFFQGHFNPHSHEGSDVSKINLAISFIHFNPHSHEGSDMVR